MSQQPYTQRIEPRHFLYVQDTNTSVVRVLVGPLTHTRFDHERYLQAAPVPMLNVRPGHYCIIKNPVQRCEGGGGGGSATELPVTADPDVVVNKHGHFVYRLGEEEVRLHDPVRGPFPLYPQEEMTTTETALPVLNELEALHLQAAVDVEVPDAYDTAGALCLRHAGDEWILRGPCTYVPQAGVRILQRLTATILREHEAVHLRAKVGFSDGRPQRCGAAAAVVRRGAGEEWLHAAPGAFIPEVEEEVVALLKPIILTRTRAIHVEAVRSFLEPAYGSKDGSKKKKGEAPAQVERRAGTQWLVTADDTEFFIPHPSAKVLDENVPLVVVTRHEHAFVRNYIDETGKQHNGRVTLRMGLTSFFLRPGEVLVGGRVKANYLLREDEALLLTASEAIQEVVVAAESRPVKRQAGDRWLLRGPCEYVPPVGVEVLEKRRRIPLDKTEGVYIRNISTGHLRAHVGSSVLLEADEELWEKPLTPLVEDLLRDPKLTKVLSGTAADSAASTTRGTAGRVRHMVVSCNVPYNAVVQVYDFKQRTARVVRGPKQVILEPHEEFTVVTLSGGKPKKFGLIKTLAVSLGPDFMTDVITVETSDHARLQLEMSYNWEFDTTKENIENLVFSVQDFIGDSCKSIASRIRGVVAAEPFDGFHKNSSNIIRLAVFGMDKATKRIRDSLKFPNGLVVTNVDIHSVDPLDPRTREALTKSVQLAIEITTTSQEATATHQATALEQEAKGRLERQLIDDKKLSETFRKQLLEIETHNAAVEAAGASKAKARAAADAALIGSETEVHIAQKQAEAEGIIAEAENDIHVADQMQDLTYREEMDNIEIALKKAMSAIEREKFQKVIAAIGRDTIVAIARAGPELQARLLKSLGLQGYLITDGTNPINLFNTAQGMTAPNIGALTQAGATANAPNRPSTA